MLEHTQVEKHEILRHWRNRIFLIALGFAIIFSMFAFVGFSEQTDLGVDSQGMINKQFQTVDWVTQIINNLFSLLGAAFVIGAIVLGFMMIRFETMGRWLIYFLLLILYGNYIGLWNIKFW